MDSALITQILEFLGMGTGILYVILEIKQKNSMWYVGMITSVLCALSFALSHLYANMTLNFYYFFISFWGLYQWKKSSSVLKDTPKVDSNVKTQKSQVDNILHLHKLSGMAILNSVIAFVIGLPALIIILDYFDKSGTILPLILNFRQYSLDVFLSKLMDTVSLSVFLEGLTSILSIIATIWLAKSYLEQWLLWVIADAFAVWLCIHTNLMWLSFLYLVYSLSAIYGYIVWKKQGKYI